MIQEQFLFPQYYVHRIAYCDKCKIPLNDKGIRLMSNPPITVLECPKCKKEYQYTETELRGEWKWRTI